MQLKVIYEGIPDTLLSKIEHYGLDYLNFLQMIIMTCNRDQYEDRLVHRWLSYHDIFYQHTQLENALLQLARLVAFNVRPLIAGGRLLKCKVIHICNVRLEVLYNVSNASNT